MNGTLVELGKDLERSGKIWVKRRDGRTESRIGASVAGLAAAVGKEIRGR
jgi:hypothetical protein